MPIKQHIKGDKTHVKVWSEDVEETAMEQLRNVASLPFVKPHVAAMPDVHAGMGATIGSVIPTTGAVVPAAVGVDIGCGMQAVRLHIHKEQLPKDLGKLRERIEALVPHGRTDNGGPNDRGAWGKTPDHIMRWYDQLGLEARLPDVIERHPGLLKGNVNTHRHLGTLGTGNHFIEVCLDDTDRVWVVLHSGSRGIGNRIGSYFISVAKDTMKRYFIDLLDPNLAYLVEGTPDADDYLACVEWAQSFARANRDFMMAATLEAICDSCTAPISHDQPIDCHHNYIAKENHYGRNVWVTRKGAVRARDGDLGIIPGSMGARSYIVRGKGDKQSLCSCSHGAGRAMSRMEAKRRYSADDLAKATEGIECRKDKDVIDEIPYAYKDIDVVMDNQSDLVEILHTLRQVVNVKG